MQTAHALCGDQNCKRGGARDDGPQASLQLHGERLVHEMVYVQYPSLGSCDSVRCHTACGDLELQQGVSDPRLHEHA